MEKMGREHIQALGAHIEAEPQSPLVHDPNFKDMCREVKTTPERVLELLARAGAEGVVARKHLEQLISEYNKKHPGNKNILAGKSLALSGAIVRRIRIKDDIGVLLTNLLTYSE